MGLGRDASVSGPPEARVLNTARALLTLIRNLILLSPCQNRIQWVPPEIAGCSSLTHLYLSTNLLQELPDSVGRLNLLKILKGRPFIFPVSGWTPSA